MEVNLKRLSNDILKLVKQERSFSRKIREILKSKDKNITKKVIKNLKKLEFYLIGGEEMYKDVLKAISKNIEKNKKKQEEK